jgi:hypothetical protein
VVTLAFKLHLVRVELAPDLGALLLVHMICFQEYPDTLPRAVN